MKVHPEMLMKTKEDGKKVPGIKCQLSRNALRLGPVARTAQRANTPITGYPENLSKRKEERFETSRL